MEERKTTGTDFFACVDKMAELYISYRKKYVMMDRGIVYVPKVRQHGKEIPHALTNSVICGHLNQNYAISVFAGEKSSKFICFDVDEGGTELAKRVVDTISGYGIPKDVIYPSYSGGKGYHIEIFFDNLVATEDLKRFYDAVCIRGGFNPRKVEFRPTNKQAIKLPLSIHHRTGKFCCYLDQDTYEPKEGMEFILGIKRFSAADFLKIVEGLPIKQPIPITDPVPKMEYRTLTNEGIERMEGDGYPTLQRTGECHNTMLAIAVHNRYRGLDREQGQKELMEWVGKQNQEYLTDSSAEIEAQILNLVKWVYSDKFNLKPAPVIHIYQEDMDRCLALSEKSEQRIFFLMLLYQRRHGRTRMSLGRIAEYIGMSRRAVASAVTRMIESKAICVTKGHTTLNEGAFRCEANTYHINHLASSGKKEIWRTEDEITPEGFMNAYKQCVVNACGEKEAKKYFTKKENMNNNES